MITTEMKDRVLNYLVKNEQDLSLEFDGEDVAPELCISPSYLVSIIEDLEGRGLLQKQGAIGYYTMCWLNAKIFDFYRAGGYEFEDHIIEGNIMKLKMEIEALEANIGKPQYDKMMALIAVVVSCFALTSGKSL